MGKEAIITLVEASQRGESDALNKLFTEFYENLYYFIFKYTKDQDLACDITQETFETIYKTIGSLKEPAAFVAWSRQIAYRHCLQHFKKKQEILVDEEDSVNSVFDIAENEGTDSIPEKILEQTEFKETIMGMIDNLPEEQRMAVLMLYYEELSVKQIAEVQGVSEGTVKSRLNYARKAIRSSVEEYEKKHNVKLHSFGIAPLLHLLFSQDKSANLLSKTMAEKMAKALVGSPVVKIGIAAKIAAMPLAGKAVACVAATAIVVGAGVGIGVAVDHHKAPAQDTEINVEYDEFDIDDVGGLTDIPPENVEAEEDRTVAEQEEQTNGNTTAQPQVDKDDSTSVDNQDVSGGNTSGGTENSDSQSALNTVFEEYMWFALALGMSDTEETITTFQSTQELTTDDFLWTVYRGTKVGSIELKMAEEYKGTDDYGSDIYIYTAKISDLHQFTQAIFGRTFDYTQASGTHMFFGKYYYDAASDSIIYDNTNSGAGGGELLTEFRYEGYHTSDDVTYVVTYKEYNVEDDTETGRTGEMKVINSNGNMTIVSNVIS